MTWQHILSIAFRQTMDPGDGLSGFLSRISIAGLVVAVALLLAVMSVMNGFEREMRASILSLVPHVTIRGTSLAADWAPVQSVLDKDPRIIEQRRFFDSDGLLIYGRDARALRLLGLEGGVALYAPFTFPALSEIDNGDLLLGRGLADALSLEVGDTVTLVAPRAGVEGVGRPGRFRLRAVIETGTELDQQLALGKASDIAALAGGPADINGVALRLDDLFAATEVRWQLSQTLPLQFYALDWTASHGNLYSAIRLSRSLILLLMTSIIAVAAFNVVSSLVLVVTDRAQSVAMLRTVGARPVDVLLIYVFQGGLIGLMGCLGGCLLGWSLAVTAPHAAELLGWWLGRPVLNTDVYPIGFLPVAIDWLDFLVVCVVAMVLCIVAAALPAWRASRLLIAMTLAR